MPKRINQAIEDSDDEIQIITEDNNGDQSEYTTIPLDDNNTKKTKKKRESSKIDKKPIDKKIKKPEQKVKPKITINDENLPPHKKPKVKIDLNENVNDSKYLNQDVAINIQERKWQDYKDKKFKQGKFSEDEIISLMHSLCRYVKDTKIGEEGIIKLVSEKIPPEYHGAWPIIAQALPERSVQSCHNLLRRKFNPNNYKGRWTLEEETQLINLVESYGREWEKIGTVLCRTANNIRDKYKMLGGANSDLRSTNKWTLEETIKQIRFIEEMVGKRFQDQKSEILMKDDQQNNVEEDEYQRVNRSKNNQHFGLGDNVMVIFQIFLKSRKL